MKTERTKWAEPSVSYPRFPKFPLMEHPDERTLHRWNRATSASAGYSWHPKRYELRELTPQRRERLVRAGRARIVYMTILYGN